MLTPKKSSRRLVQVLQVIGLTNNLTNPTWRRKIKCSGGKLQALSSMMLPQH
jgi:hypothetical protein